jgi:hypothetical protein
MSKWQHLAVTSSGQPVLLASERKILMESKVGIYQGYAFLANIYYCFWEVRFCFHLVLALRGSYIISWLMLARLLLRYNN